MPSVATGKLSDISQNWKAAGWFVYRPCYDQLFSVTRIIISGAAIYCKYTSYYLILTFLFIKYAAIEWI